MLLEIIGKKQQFRGQGKAPNTKLQAQRSTKFQASNETHFVHFLQLFELWRFRRWKFEMPERRFYWSLEFLWSLELGVWSFSSWAINFFQQRFAHHFNRRRLAGPNLQRCRALVQKHSYAVGCAASGVFGTNQQ